MNQSKVKVYNLKSGITQTSNQRVNLSYAKNLLRSILLKENSIRIAKIEMGNDYSSKYCFFLYPIEDVDIYTAVR